MTFLLNRNVPIEQLTLAAIGGDVLRQLRRLAPEPSAGPCEQNYNSLGVDPPNSMRRSAELEANCPRSDCLRDTGRGEGWERWSSY